MSRRAEVYEALTDEGDRQEARRCVVCQVLEQDPTEEQLHRLVRFYEGKVAQLSQRLTDRPEVWELEVKVREQQQIIERQQLIISNHRRP